MQKNRKPILELNNVSKTFADSAEKQVAAVRNLSLIVYEGESLGIVGESGCGKSTLIRLITRMTPVTSGSILFEGKDITHSGLKERRETYRRMQMVFQNPYSAFSPRMTIGTFLEEGLVYFGILSRREAKKEALRLLKLVELPETFYDRLPHQLSGGQLQRVVIARAVSISPGLLLLDEPTSALDVSVQSRILKLLVQLKRERGLTYLFIGHDLAVVRSISDRIAIMYAGEIVELLSSEHLVEEAEHPYTKELLSAVFSVRDRGIREIAIRDLGVEQKSVPGCPYLQYCPYALLICKTKKPRLLERTPGHAVACHQKSEIEK